MFNICLGSANFYNNYGIDNVRINNLEKILKFSSLNGIHLIDYSILYGKPSKKYIKILKDLNFKLCLKLPIKTKGYCFNYILDELLQTWDIEINSITIHDPWNIEDEENRQISEKFSSLKKIYPNIDFGISIYRKNDLKYFHSNSLFSMVQLPYSPLSTELYRFCKKIKDKNLNIQIRSIFLQGILLKKKLPTSIKNYKLLQMHKLWLEFLKENSYNALEYCINVAKLSNANDIIIGVNNLDQFKQIIHLFNRDIEEVKLPNFFFDHEILDPRIW